MKKKPRGIGCRRWPDRVCRADCVGPRPPPPSFYTQTRANARAYDAYGQQSRRRRREVGGEKRAPLTQEMRTLLYALLQRSPPFFYLQLQKEGRKKRGKSPQGGGGGEHCQFLAGLTVNSFLTGSSSQVWEPFFLRGGDSYELAVRQILFVGTEYTCSGEKSSKKVP